ncbi:MAG TPA: hypothetical protein VLQ89_08750 [Candidatus Binatia bacterium]|nr:hypothetical protein [Candidatus Binatia bacterium]
MNRKKHPLKGDKKQQAKKRTAAPPPYPALFSFSALLLPLITAAAEARLPVADRAGHRP